MLITGSDRQMANLRQRQRMLKVIGGELNRQTAWGNANGARIGLDR